MFAGRAMGEELRRIEEFFIRFCVVRRKEVMECLRRMDEVVERRSYARTMNAVIKDATLKDVGKFKEVINGMRIKVVLLTKEVLEEKREKTIICRRCSVAVGMIRAVTVDEVEWSLRLVWHRSFLPHLREEVWSREGAASRGGCCQAEFSSTIEN